MATSGCAVPLLLVFVLIHVTGSSRPLQGGVRVPKHLQEGHVYLSYLGGRGRSGDRTVTRPDLYLIQFGYASRWNTSTVKQQLKLGRSIGLEGAELRDAIKAFQIQNDLPVTETADKTTLRAMARPRCGVSDVRRGRFAVFPDKWKNLTLSYNFVKYSSRLPKKMVTLSLRRAFSYWEAVTSVRFIQVADGKAADLRIGFYSGFHDDGAYNSFDGPEGILAHAFFPRDGNIHFDDTEEFTEGTKRGKNLRIVAAHEIGHALGLDHSWAKGALMYPSYQGYVPHEDFQLAQDDVAGIQHMYGRARMRRGAVKPGSPEVSGTVSKADRKQANRMSANQPVATGRTTTTTTTTTTAAVTTTTVTTATPRTTSYAPITLPLWPKPTPGRGQPSPCKAKVDAAFLWHDAAKYFLRGSLLYRQGPGPSSAMSYDFPRSVRRYLVNPPAKTDAAVYSPYSTNLYLFSGNQVYVYDRYGYRRERATITDPDFPVNMDAAFVNREGTVCFIKDDMIYQFDEWRRVIESFSSLTEVYRDVPVGIDAVINDSHWVLDYEYLYFFKGTKYYKVDIRSRSVVRGYPREIGGPWFGCSTWTVPK